MGVRVPPFALALLAAQAALCVVILITRAASAAVDGRWSETTGTEGVGITIIRRLAAGGPLYQNPSVDSTIAIYNYGFYRAYAVAAAFTSRLHQPLLLRSVTLAAAVCGAVALASLVVKRLPGNSATRPAIAAAIAVSAMLGPFVGWFLVSARPDMAAIAFEVTGLALLDRSRNRLGMIVAASVSFGCALAFKQTAIGMLLGACVWLLVERRITTIFILMAGVAAAAAIGIATSGPYYFQHVFVAPASSDMGAPAFIEVWTSIALVGGPVLACALVCGDWRGRRETARQLPLTWPMLTSLVIALPQLARYGASRNYVIGAFALATGLTWTWALAPNATGRRRLATVALTLETAIAASYFVPGHLGVLKLNPPTASLVQAVQHGEGTNAGPYYSDDSNLALLWPTGTATVEVTDPSVYPYYVRKGFVHTTVEDRIRQCQFGTLLLGNSPLLDLALHAGYVTRLNIDGGRAWLVRSPACGRPAE